MIANKSAGFRTGGAIDPTLSMVPMQALMKWLGADEGRNEAAERQALPAEAEMRHVPAKEMRENSPPPETPVILKGSHDVVEVRDAPQAPDIAGLQKYSPETNDANVPQPGVVSAPAFQPVSSGQPMLVLPPALVMPPVQTGERWEPWAEESDIFAAEEPETGFFTGFPSAFDSLLSPESPSAEVAAPSRLLGFFAFASIAVALGAMVYLLRLF